MDDNAIRILVEPEAVRRRLQRLPRLRRHRLGAAHAQSFWAKPGRHFNASYVVASMQAEGGRLLASGFAVDPERAITLAAQSGAHECGTNPARSCRACCTFADEIGLLWQLFPHDYRLPTLPQCLQVEDVAPRLDIGTITDCSAAGYRPGMRCQIRYHTAEGAVFYGKVAVERIPGAAFNHHRQIQQELGTATDMLRLSPALRYVEELQLSLIAGAPGRSLHELLEQRQATAADLRIVIAALGHLHALELDGIERVYQPKEEIALLEGWTELVGSTFSHLTEPLARCQSRLAAEAPAGEMRCAVVHRDFYDKQIVLSPDGVTLLDMDTVCRGDPEIDVGNFCAHLRLRGLQWDCSRHMSDFELEVLRSYGAPLSIERVDWYRSAALLRLACVYALRPHWRPLAPALIAQAMEKRR